MTPALAIAALVGAWSLLLGLTYGALVGRPGPPRGAAVLVLYPVALVLAPAAIAAPLLGREAAQLLVAAGAIGWGATALMVGRAAGALRAREFVDAARLAGVPPWTIVRRHVIPNLVRTLLVAAALSAALAGAVGLALHAVASDATLLVSSRPE